MRGLFLLLFFAQVAPAFGAACDEIKNQLVLIESKLQTARLPRCEGDNKLNCCDPDKEELTCSSFLVLQNKHNALMGNLVIFEGLISLGMAMEADYKKVQELKPEKLVVARDALNSFLHSFEKASLIDKSLDSEFFFDQDGNAYSGKTPEDFNLFVSAQCARDDQKIKDFCAELSKAGSAGVNGYEDVITSLNGFGVAHSNVGLQKADKIKEYKNYKKTLQLSVDGKSVPYTQDSPFIKKLQELKTALKHPDDAIDNEKAKKIAALAKELDGLQANYGSVVSVDQNFNELFDKNVRNGIASFNQVSRALLGKEGAIQNLDKLTSILDKREQSSRSSLANIIKEETSCEGSIDKRIECFEETDPGDDQRAKIKLDQIKKQLDSTKDFSRLKRLADSSKACISKSVNDSETRECAKKLQEALNLTTKDEVDSLRAQIYELETAMENMNGEENIDQLQFSKAMGLKALKNKGCYASDAYKMEGGIEATCKQSPLEDFTQEVLELSKDTGEIIDFSDNKYLNGFDMKSTAYAAYKAQFLKDCEEGEADPELCRIYKSDEVANGVFADKLSKARDNYLNYQVRRVPAKADFSQAKKARSGEAFGAGLATSLITKGVPWYMQYEARNSYHKQMMGYHENRLSFLQRRNDFWKANPTIPVYYHPYMNYGYSQYDFNQSSSFGGGNANLMYKDSYDFTQFTFSPTVMDQFGSSNFGGPTTGVSSGGLSGGFSF